MPYRLGGMAKRWGWLAVNYEKLGIYGVKWASIVPSTEEQ